MVATIKKGAAQKEIQDLFKEPENKKESKKGFDAYKFCDALVR